MADIAVISSAAATAAVHNSTDAAADPQAGGGIDAVFALMLQQAVQVAAAPQAAPANDVGTPNSANDNSGAAAETQTEPSAQPAVTTRPLSRASDLLAVMMGNASSKSAPQQSAPKPQTPLQGAATQSGAKADDPASTATSEKDSSDTAAPVPEQSADATQQSASRDRSVSAKDDKPAETSDAKTKSDAKTIVQADANGVPIPPQIQIAAVAPPTATSDTAPKSGNTDKRDETTRSATSAPGPSDRADAGKALTDAKQKDATSTPSSSNRADAGKALTDAKQTATTSGPQTDSNASASTNAQVGATQHDTAPSTPASASAQMAGSIAPHDTLQTAPALAVNLQVTSGHPGSDAPSGLDSLGLTIAAKSQDGIKHFDISMTPPELGRVEVRLSMGDDGKTQASLVVDKPQTLALLQQDAPNLNRALNDAGLSMSNNGLNFSLRSGQERQNDSGQAPRGRGRALSINAVAATAPVSNSGSIASLTPDGVRLDIRV